MQMCCVNCGGLYLGHVIGPTARQPAHKSLPQQPPGYAGYGGIAAPSICVVVQAVFVCLKLVACCVVDCRQHFWTKCKLRIKP